MAREVAGKGGGEAPVKGRAVLFELENLAAKGRRVVYESLKKAMENREAKITPIHFSRYVLDGPVPRSYSRLLSALGKGRVSEDKLADEVKQQIVADLTADSVTPDKGLQSLLSAVREKGYAVGAVSCLDKASAKELAAKLDAGDGLEVVSYEAEGRRAPSTDAWARLAKLVGVQPTRCVALGTSSGSCFGALSAGMRCIVVSDEFTEFQDFGGADGVVDGLNTAGVREVLRLLDLLS